MFNKIDEAIEFIENQRSKHTLEEFKDILDKLHINTKQKNMIHIAGTNGKGSTVNYLRALLNAHGYKVGTFTSPYIVCHNDRIRIDNKNISNEDLLYYINKYYDIIKLYNMSMFEIDVLIMLDYFNDKDLDYRIIECGIGGAHDKTNVIEPIISAITNIGEDHLDLIGPSLYDVINEKVGIIKPHQTFVTTEISGTILARFQEICDSYDVRMVVVPEYDVSHYPFAFDYRNMSFTLYNQGIYQVQNARLALTIANQLIKFNEAKTVDVIENTIWEGRYELIEKNNKRVIIDGAHNKPGLKALLKSLEAQKNPHRVIIFACLKDKNDEEMIQMLDQNKDDVFLTTFNDDRIQDLSKKALGSHMKYIKDYHDAINTALIKYDEIVVTGSLHFISLARNYILQKTY